MKPSEHILYENTHANHFTEAYPIGNGRLGGMVYGKAGDLRLGLNHDELWSGYRGDNSQYLDRDAFKEARKLVLAGKYKEAQLRLEKGLARYDGSAYLTLGDLNIKFGVANVADEPKDFAVTDYRRELDLRESVARVSYVVDGNRINCEYIASYPKSVIAIKVSAEKPVDFDVVPFIEMLSAFKAEGTRVTFFGECNKFNARQQLRSTLPENSEAHSAVRFAAAFDASSNGTVTVANNEICVRGATEAIVYFTAETSYKDGYEHGKDNYRALIGEYLDAAMAIPYSDLKEGHVADVTALFDRVELSLSASAPEAQLPTFARVKAFAEGSKDYELLTLQFNMGRYLLIAASRPGSRATNLQGIWNDQMEAPWNSNYTTNINTEMNYWPALPCSLPELVEPLEGLVRILGETGKLAAKNIFGANGVAASHNADPFGYACPASGWACWAFFPVSVGWLSRELYNKYEYTLDEEYLKNIYGIISDVAEFFLDTLVDDGEYLIFAPATSAENHYFLPNGEKCSVARSTTIFASIIRESITHFIAASEKLGVKSELTERAKVALPRLLPLRITDDGRIEEWYFGGKSVSPSEPEVHHRHISHLYDLYPSNLINPAEPELFAAARESLRVRGDEATGWSLGWKMNCYARLRDGDGVMRLTRMFLRPVEPENVYHFNGGGVYPNLFCAHPPFQIDGNFGYTAGICEMLIANEPNGDVTPLPALPPELSEGFVRGIAVKGGKHADLAWKDGKVTSFKLY